LVKGTGVAIFLSAFPATMPTFNSGFCTTSISLTIFNRCEKIELRKKLQLFYLDFFLPLILWTVHWGFANARGLIGPKKTENSMGNSIAAGWVEYVSGLVSCENGCVHSLHWVGGCNMSWEGRGG